jgi:UDP-2-acetamido-3-amino-2,3-dideoxy-glucuronate N-acetyltransferase
MIDASARVHPSALVCSSTVGARTRIWQFASVIRNAVIGADCSIASGVCIDGSRIGDGCVIAHNLAMGPGFLLGNEVFVGPNVTFCNDLWPRASKGGFDVTQYKGDDMAVIVEDGASIGAGAVILPGVHIGAGAMIGANAVVTGNVPARHVWTGNGRIRPILDEENKQRIRFARSGLECSREFLAEQGFAL